MLFNSFADQQDLFTSIPDYNSVGSALNANNIPFCDTRVCLATQFYDFYTTKNLTNDDAKLLINQIITAWINENFKQDDTNFKNAIQVGIFNVVPYKAPNG